VSQDTHLQAETVVLAALLSIYAIGWLVRRLRRTRPELQIGRQLVLAFGLRWGAIAGVATSGIGSTVRGGDEGTFLAWAHDLADSPFGHGFFPHGHYQLHTVLFAMQLKFGDFSEGAMRLTQVGLALFGMVLIIAAVHDLAGARSANVTAWFMAVEPASIFFNSALHKEPMMVLASGLMVFGGTRIWRRLDLSGLVLMALAAFIAVETRPYAGWFLISAGAMVILHASLRRVTNSLKAMPLVYAIIIAGFVAAPAVIQATSKKSLSSLQVSQNFNTSKTAVTGGANTNNLALERVDYSSRSGIVTNLPKRMLDILVRPYPWQVSNASQQLGALGSMFALAGMVLMIGALWRRRGHVLELTGPILYPMLFLLMAYALSAGNAGTGFRYRTHIVTLGVAMLFALREGVVPERESEHARLRRKPRPESGRRLAAVQ